uniref:Mediator of RNA polymerase II transcription subunit 25 n=1 Tax=Saccoglossus kowalevskii TaxID=10224 RepID=A0ABM0MD69_SACKO|nr:PREDICTED: mediator of RNA polymerase II transcription subunit 25-like [Saccoglossus kowalevskii]
MVVADQSTSACDVVFVVEGTANLHAYFEYMKNSYILPTLEYFNGGPVVKYGDFGPKIGGNTFYSLVVYNTADCAPNQSCICTDPTTKAWKLLDSFDNIEFISGAGEKFSLISEGLGTALTLFDDMKSMRQGHSTSVQVQKHCILICNSPPYPLPSQESFHYNGLTSEQLAAMLAERGIHLSILSPRKLPELQKLYDKACGELQIVATRDYATDPRHMILLKGYQLAERTAANITDAKEVAIVKPVPAVLLLPSQQQFHNH